MVNKSDIQEKFKLDETKIKNPIVYLKDRCLIKVTFFLGGNFIVDKIYPFGIDVMENKEEFERAFNYKLKK